MFALKKHARGDCYSAIKASDGTKKCLRDVHLVFEEFIAKQRPESVSSCSPSIREYLKKFPSAVNTWRVRTPGDFRKHFTQSGALQVGKCDRISPASPFIVSTQQTCAKPALEG